MQRNLRSVLPMKVAKYGYVLISAVFCAAGLLILLPPDPPEAAMGTFFGIALLSFGAIKLVGYFSRDLFRLAFQYDLQFGVLLLILGVITLTRRHDTLQFICAAYGISMIADCLFKGGTAFDARHFGIRLWWLTLVLAIGAGLAGVLVMIAPAVTDRSVHTLLGLQLLLEGLLSMSVALSMVKIIDHQQPDRPDNELWEET